MSFQTLVSKSFLLFELLVETQEHIVNFYVRTSSLISSYNSYIQTIRFIFIIDIGTFN